MARKMKRVFAILMVLLLCAAQIAVPAMAAEAEEVEAAPVAAVAVQNDAVKTVETSGSAPAAVELTVVAADAADAQGHGQGQNQGPGQNQNQNNHENGSGNGNGASTPDENTSVDHIDINVNAGGTVVLNGEEHYVDIGVDASDAPNVSITNEGMEGYTDMEVSGDVDTSTDANGENQIRIEGSFDIGTMENPTEYTVQLVKDVVVGEGEDAQSITVTLSTTTGYWDLDNLCPPLWSNGTANTLWQEGNFLGSETGIDLQLQPVGSTGGEDEEEEATNGQLTIQKTVIGFENGLEETTKFYFDVTDENGNVVYNDVAVTVGAGQTVGILVIENVEFGTYTIIEIVNEDVTFDGYNLDTNYNLLDGTITNVVVVSTDNEEGYINVINTYTKETEPEETEPEETEPEVTEPEETEPEETEPEETEPEETEPEETEPEETEPEETEPEETEPEETEPEETEPEETEPEETEPEVTEPEETEPEETEPEETEPEVTEPEETEPEETEPEETEPEETEPEETEPEETQPKETEPEETEPEETDPYVPMLLDDEIEIPDEEVPLASAPKTGDISMLWAVLSGLSAGGMMLLNRKRED